MFSKEQRIAYQSIQAPESLREQILSNQGRISNTVSPAHLAKGAVAVAACTVFLIGSILFARPANDFSVTANGNAISTNGIVVATVETDFSQPRVASMDEYQITIGYEPDFVNAYDTISEGQILTESADGLVWIYPGDDITTNHQIKLDTDKGMYLLTLSFHTDSNEWVLRCEKQKL